MTLASQLEGCGRAAAVDGFLDECARDPALAEALMPMLCGGVILEAGESCNLNAECSDGPVVCRPTAIDGTNTRCLPTGGVRHTLPEGTCGDLCDSAFDCGAGLACGESGMCLPDGTSAAPVMACRSFDPSASADYLAARSSAWQAERECAMNCHTTLPFLLVGDAHTPGAREVAESLAAQAADRVSSWESVAVWYDDEYGAGKEAQSRATEAVLNAVAILRTEALTAEEPSEVGREALRVLWSEQDETGGWYWLDFGLIPWETREARASGMAWAALAAASFGEEYLTTTEEPDATGIARLREGLRGLMTEPIHDRLMLLWAASEWPGLLSDDEKAAIVADAKAMQLPDGGWNLADLGQWRAQAGYPMESTAYGTALATYVLIASGVSPSDPDVVRACEWLLSHQDPSGAFPDTSMNRDRDFNHDLITDAATAMSILALTAALGS
ncbi:MAG: prenyltransferase/squalene oxidase repeat-containing protein [Gemmatimonadota bacterium]|jgi:hypothetical protein